MSKGKDAGEQTPSAARAEREAKLAQALRDNLKRRKAAARAKKGQAESS